MYIHNKKYFSWQAAVQMCLRAVRHLLINATGRVSYNMSMFQATKEALAYHAVLDYHPASLSTTINQQNTINTKAHRPVLYIQITQGLGH